MKKRLVFRVLALFALSALAFGASPVATISSSGTFELHGVLVRTQGIPSWPVMSGDIILTDSTPAAIQFHDGSMITLSDQSRARVERSGNSLVFRLLDGSMQVVAARETAIKFFNNTQTVNARPGTPVRVVTSGAKPGHFVLAGRTPPPPVSGQ